MERSMRMDRRAFLKSGITGAGAAASALAAQDAHAGSAKGREFYEIRLYHFTNADTQQRFGDHLKSALIPALRRAGAGPVGVFTQEDPQLPAPAYYVLLSLASLDAVSSLPERLQVDEQYQREGAPLLSLPIADAPYAGFESRLLRAFKAAPKLNLPAETLAGKGRRFQLRTYLSPSEAAGFKKVEMFESGEMAMFPRAGMQPVFYAQGLIGTDLPSMTYMLTFPDGIEPNALWDKWKADPEYKRLFSLPQYLGTVIRAITPMLRPTPFSQI
jgi:hypothetical protein